MKNSTLTKLLLIAGAFCFIIQNTFAQVVTDSVEMGMGYTHDVYYNMNDGEKTLTEIDNWDLGFTTAMFDFNVFINDGAGVRLYTYPDGDIFSWNNVDITNIESWTPLFNDDTDWDFGAFAQNMTGHPDYGWGVYDDVSHNVNGDSIYIVQTTAGEYKKLKIDQMISIAVTFSFTFADIDGSNEQTIELVAADYNDKNYVYYDLTNNAVVDREPPKEDWHLLFTRWVADDYLPTEQVVTGTWQNKNVEIGEMKNFNIQDTCYLDAEFSSEKNVVGWDWKYFNLETFSYSVHDSLVYFVKTMDDELYLVEFTAFESGMSSTAKSIFKKQLLNPPAPTNPVIDDAANTFGWTAVDGYPDATSYEYFVAGDTLWHDCDANPQAIPAGDFAAGDVKIRLKADEASCIPWGLALSNDAAFTGIRQIVQKNIRFSAYPNPATDVLNIRLTQETAGNNTVQVYNVLGALVYQDNFTGTRHVFETSNLENGTYLLKIQSKKEFGNLMFVINR